jgi:hypothetical protein
MSKLNFIKKAFIISILLGTTLFARPPFLSQGLIPHYTKKIAINWDDSFLELTDSQKVKLLKIRKDTMNKLGKLKTKLEPLEQELADKIISGIKPEELYTIVDKIAIYKKEATIVHLNCVYNTQKVLTQEQLDLLPSL